MRAVIKSPGHGRMMVFQLSDKYPVVMARLKMLVNRLRSNKNLRVMLSRKLMLPSQVRRKYIIYHIIPFLLQTKRPQRHVLFMM